LTHTHIIEFVIDKKLVIAQMFNTLYFKVDGEIFVCKLSTMQIIDFIDTFPFRRR